MIPTSIYDGVVLAIKFAVDAATASMLGMAKHTFGHYRGASYKIYAVYLGALIDRRAFAGRPYLGHLAIDRTP